MASSVNSWVNYCVLSTDFMAEVPRRTLLGSVLMVVLGTSNPIGGAAFLTVAFAVDKLFNTYFFKGRGDTVPQLLSIIAADGVLQVVRPLFLDSLFSCEVTRSYWKSFAVLSVVLYIEDGLQVAFGKRSYYKGVVEGYLKTAYDLAFR